MITIHKSKIVEEDEQVKLITDVDVDNERKQIWVAVKKEYGSYLCYERADAVLIGLLSYALRNKHDITCEAPVTEELLYNINEVLLPTLIRSDNTNYPVQIQCQTANCLKSDGGG